MSDSHFSHANTTLPARQAFGVRLATGGLLGLIIAVLINVSDDKDTSHWRETLAGTLSLIAFVIWAGAGSMRRISLAIWSTIGALVVGYMLWNAFDESMGGSDIVFFRNALIFPLLFFAHELVSSADQAGKYIAPYETYFDEAWKRGVQLALAILFTLLFWGILWLGAALLGFIGFKWLTDLLTNEYFAWPMSGIAFGAAVHLGDVQTKLLANVRNLILGVLSWLLPVITIIGGIFAVSLLVSGLAPLWATKAATVTLLSGCIGFVLLINAAYQQGDIERPVPVVLKWCVRGAALLLLIFSALAAWSLGLRINQYGLSPDRVFAGLGVIIALLYGAGYSFAVFVPGRWMAKIETLNIYFAMAICLLFIAILTPVAAPGRLSVSDQVARLNTGKVSIANFDWWLLKDETGPYGKSALAKLAKSSNAAIAAKAKAAIDDNLGERPNQDRDEPDVAPVTLGAKASILVVVPAGGKLPDSFVKTDFTDNDRHLSSPECLRQPPPFGQIPSCKAALLDLNGDGAMEILIREGPSLTIFTQIRGQWMGNKEYLDIGSLEADFDAGKIQSAPALWNDVIIGSARRNAPNFVEPEIEPSPPLPK